MTFSKPVTELTFDDIQALVDNQEPEGVTLEYKRELNTSPGGKKELAKDVSAMANSQGGHLIIGLAEEDHGPKMPEQFVERMLGRQKVEEWLDQVLNSNIQPRVNVHIKPIPVPGNPEECVVVMHVPPSPRVPHMITAQNDNRYYVRHNCEVLPAEEYEVRDMFERGRRMREEVKEYLRKRGYFEPDDQPDFALNKLTRQLGVAYFDETANVVLEPAHTVVSFVCCPTMLGDRIDASSSEFRQWLNPAQRYYYPPGIFLPHQVCRATLDGVVCGNDLPLQERTPGHPIREYLAVHRSGYTEFGYGDGIQYQGRRLVNFVKMVGRFWQFVGFVSDLYRYAKLSTTAIILLNLANVEGTHLGMFGEGWRRGMDPFARTLCADQSLESHIQIMKELDIERLEPHEIEATVREIAASVGNAFGQDRPRCFNARDDAFPVEQLRAYIG